MSEDFVYVGIDPGLHGAVAFKDGIEVTVYDPPLIQRSGRGNKNKKDYDIKGMSDILREYVNRNVICVIESVFSMTGQGVSSSFNFGRGKGIWEGLTHAFQFDVRMVSPQTWKKEWPDLSPPRLKKEPGQTKSEYEREKRRRKAAAKEMSRNIARDICPELSESFKLVNSDGRAEAVLLAIYAERHHQK